MRLSKVMMAVIAGVFIMSVNPAHASLDKVLFQQELDALNRIKPLQNPKFEKSRDILTRNVIDRQNRIIGGVDDVLIRAQDGSVSTLQVTFDRLRLDQSAYLNMEEMNIKAASNSYQLSFRSDEIEDLYPQLLNAIETAAGGDSGFHSLNAIIGRPLIDHTGRKLGVVQDVFFGNRGAQVQAVFVRINSGIIRNFGVALPYNAIEFVYDRGVVNAVLPRDQANMLLGYARDKQ